MSRDKLNFLFLNFGHLYDHYFVLIFATVAALTLASEWNMTYAALIPYATPGFIAFGMFAVPAGWLADKWDRRHMMTVFFIGIGASAMATAAAQSPLQIGIGLFCIGTFAAIYHPVGLALVVEGQTKTGVILAVNGIWGNVGVGVAAMATGVLIDLAGWRAAFLAPGVLSIATGLLYGVFVRFDRREAPMGLSKKPKPSLAGVERRTIIHIFAVIFFSTAVGGLTFQSTTFALPKIFDERLTDLAGTATLVGTFAFVVFSVAAAAQLVVGFFTDRYSVRWVFGAVATTQAVFFLAVQDLTGWPALIVSVIVMMAVFGQIPINDVLVGRISTEEWRSRIFAFRYLVTFTAMASTLPIIAWLHATWGFTALFGVLAAAAAAMLCAVLTLPGSTVVTGKPAPAE
jgi:MFS family permease